MLVISSALNLSYVRTSGKYAVSFQTNKTIFTINQCKKCHVHPEYSARIQTHNLSNMNRLP